MNSGGAAKISSIFIAPFFRSFLRRARCERTSLARRSASRRCSRVLTGVADIGSEEDIRGYYMNSDTLFARRYLSGTSIGASRSDKSALVIF